MKHSDPEFPISDERSPNPRPQEVPAAVAPLQGTGGLTFEPPSAGASELNIGFAHELLDDVELLPEFQNAPTTRAPDATQSNAPTRSSASNAPTVTSTNAQYPLAKAALARLIARHNPLAAPHQDALEQATFTSSQAASEAVPAPESAPASARAVQKAARPPVAKKEVPFDPGAFVIGSQIMRPPPAIQTPVPERVPATLASPTQGKMDDMVDLFFVGADDAQQDQQIHLQFKEDVLGGLYFTLKKTDAGLIAHFTVQDPNTRRLVEANAHALVARMAKKGMHIVETVVEVQGEAREKNSGAHEYFTSNDKFDEKP